MTENTTASGQPHRYTKKPVTIDAIRWTGKNLREVIAFTDGPPDAVAAKTRGVRLPSGVTALDWKTKP